MVEDTLGEYYLRFIQGLYMFDARCSYILIPVETLVENDTEQVQNQLKVDGYTVPFNLHEITRQ